jgi:hypothetical protein
MASAPNSLSQAAALNTLIDDYAQLSQAGTNGSGSSKELFQHVLADLEKFKAILGSQNQPGSGIQPLTSASQPTPFSTDAIPSNVQNDPMSQLPPDTLDRAQSLTSNTPMMSDAISTDGNGDASGAGVVREHMHPIVTDPEVGTASISSGLSTGDSSSGLGGTSFTSADNYASLDQANSDLESAKDAALADPTNPAKQLAFQEAAEKVQIMFGVLQQISSIKASMADAAIKAMKVTPS